MGKVPTEVMTSRQTWFWRRTTLQLTLVFFGLSLMFSMLHTAFATNDWPTAVVQIAHLVAMAWLVTMYFAMVDSAAEVKAILNEASGVIQKLTDAAPNG